jgi:molybdenum cofactor synthesis domain-containing protein
MPEAHDRVKIGLLSVSDRASAGVYEDKGIPALQAWLTRALRNNIEWDARVIPDEQAGISAALVDLVDHQQCHLVLTTGGTGPALRDVTPEATLAAADKVMPGFGEQMRQISLHFVPTAILSRQVAVIRKRCLTAFGHATGSGHLCRRALLHRPDRWPLPRNRRLRLQGVPPEVSVARQMTTGSGSSRMPNRPYTLS